MSQLIELLLIEDNPSDVRLTQEYFKEYRIRNCLKVVTDCTEALRFLRNQDEYTSELQPAIVLLSSRMLLNGDTSLVQQIQAETEQRQIVLVLLTACEGEDAVLHGILPHSPCIAKPLNVEALLTLVKHRDDFWFSIDVDEVNKPASVS